MTEQEAVRSLREMYERGWREREAGIAALLFGIRHADEIANWPQKELDEIARLATGRTSYGSLIDKGRRAARYVQWRAC